MKRLAVVFALALCPAPAAAQIPWESPLLVSPGAPGGLSVLFVDYGLAPEQGMGGVLSWRSTNGPGGTGLRIAAVPRRYDDTPGVAAGFDVSWPLVRHGADMPIDLVWTTGVGGSWAEYAQIAVPFALTAGRPIDGALLFHPYVGTRVVLSGFLGPDRPETFDYALAADLGFDLSFDRGRDLRFRFAGSFGDRHALIAGLQAAVR